MESMEEIYQNHSKKVYTFLLSKTCNHELAEELTQETFFCAVNSINKFKGNSSVLTWLSYQIAHEYGMPVYVLLIRDLHHSL